MIISSVVTSEDGKNVRDSHGRFKIINCFQAVREVKFKYAPDVVVSETIEPHEPTVVRITEWSREYHYHDLTRPS
jgi:hypothetical protein